MPEMLEFDDGRVRIDVITVVYHIKEDGDSYSFAVSESGTLFKITSPDRNYLEQRRNEILDKIESL